MRRRSFLRGLAAAAASTAVPVPAVAKLLADPYAGYTRILGYEHYLGPRPTTGMFADAFNYGMSMLRFDGEYEHIEWCDVVSPPPMVRK